NIPQDEKWQQQYQGRIVGILSSLSRQGFAQQQAQLMLWPEAALPDNFMAHNEWVDTMHVLAAGSRTPILFGTIDVVWTSPTHYEYYNSAMVVDAAGRVGGQPAYHKTYLVPIVERVPFVNPTWFASLKFFGGMGRGATPKPFDLPIGRVGTLICYESIFLQRSRLFRREGASFLVNITNDAWFGRSVAVYQHEAHLALRAIENRVGIVRDANTGISEYIDPLGRSHGATALFVPAVRTYQVQTTTVLTLYDHVGDWLGAVSVLATLAMLGVAAAKRRP
ncbi:MAG: apolipoprotein N-acyltransferase, partial [Gemmatimonadaceae bacterium]